jgi:hypothetical protein
MRRVLACVGIAAACFAVLPAAHAALPTGDGVSPQQQTGRPVINEVQTRGTAGGLDQFIEIANASRTEQVDLSGWYIQVYSSNNTVLQTVFFPEDASLLPLGAGPAEEVLWTMSSQAFTGGAVDQPGAITVDIPSNGGVALFNPGGTRVDGVAFSSSVTAAVEGQPLAPQPTALDRFNAAYGRNIVSQDTNNNQQDFMLQLRSPEQLN